jgi:hypothetical protein
MQLVFEFQQLANIPRHGIVAITAFEPKVKK